jgi:hypothetical protein
VDGICGDLRVTVSDLTDLETLRIVHSSCRVATAVADHTKIGRFGFIRLAPTVRIHRLITDSLADPQEPAASRRTASRLSWCRFLRTQRNPLLRESGFLGSGANRDPPSCRRRVSAFSATR